jgi:hypothetical protein
MSDVLSGVTLAAALGAFALTAMVSLRARVEPLYVVVRGIFAFLAVLVLARWSAGALDSLGPIVSEDGDSRAGDSEQGSSGRP